MSTENEIRNFLNSEIKQMSNDVNNRQYNRHYGRIDTGSIDYEDNPDYMYEDFEPQFDDEESDYYATLDEDDRESDYYEHAYGCLVDEVEKQSEYIEEEYDELSFPELEYIENYEELPIPEAEKTILQRAAGLRKTKKYDDAIKLCNEVLEEKPHNLYAICLKIATMGDKRDHGAYDLAIQYMRKYAKWEGFTNTMFGLLGKMNQENDEFVTSLAEYNPECLLSYIELLGINNKKREYLLKTIKNNIKIKKIIKEHYNKKNDTCNSNLCNNKIQNYNSVCSKQQAESDKQQLLKFKVGDIVYTKPYGKGSIVEIINELYILKLASEKIIKIYVYNNNFSIHNIVYHKEYGRGEILGITNWHSELYYNIKFNSEIKSILSTDSLYTESLYKKLESWGNFETILPTDIDYLKDYELKELQNEICKEQYISGWKKEKLYIFYPDIDKSTIDELINQHNCEFCSPKKNNLKTETNIEVKTSEEEIEKPFIKQGFIKKFYRIYLAIDKTISDVFHQKKGQ